MAVEVGSTKPVYVRADNDLIVTVINAAGGTVYYGPNNQVTSSSNDGSITAGSSATFTTGTWFISASSSRLELDTTTSEENEWTTPSSGVHFTTYSVQANGDITARAAVTPVMIGAHTAGDGLKAGTATFVQLGTGNWLAAGKICSTAGLGAGNSAAASTLGTVVKKLEVFNAAGVSLGFLPIYDAIT